MSRFLDDFKTRMLTFTSITALIDDKCYIGELANVTGPRFPCVTINKDAGTLVEKIIEYRILPFRIWAWGKTRDSVEDIYDEILDNIHNVKFTDGLGTTNYVPWELTSPIYNYDPNMCHHYLMTRWQVTIIKP
jgi:hypothetical protein